jgi:hypothetical protein
LNLVEGKEGREYVQKTAREVLDFILDTHCSAKTEPAEWNLEELATDMLAFFDSPGSASPAKLEGWASRAAESVS